jgi:hypothetical protein
MDAATFQLLHSRGVRQLHFGGSETEGVARYISKFPVHHPRLREQALVL